jgi:hypothetical protein
MSASTEEPDGLWAWLRNALARDDLFLRVSFLLAGLLLGGLGIGMLSWALTDTVAHDAIWPTPLALVLGGSLCAWGGVLIIRCFVPARWRIARFAETVAPDPTGIRDGAFLVLLCCLPAVLLTLLLRCAGVNGKPLVPRSRPARKGKPGKSPR